MSKVFDQLVDKFLETREIGHYNRDNYSIMLYDIKNDEKIINRIKKDIALITNKCKVIILNPNDYLTNINIIDIDL